MRVRTVDAFTDCPYTGNPAAVVLFDEPRFPADELLQRFADEMHLSETAYAHPLPGDEEADWALRWFTPVKEVDLCGHATLATAHLIAQDGSVADPVRFRTRSGILTADPGGVGGITLDFPTAPLTDTAAPDGLAAALGAEPVRVYDTGPLGDLLVELADEPAVRALAPSSTGLAALPYRGVIVTAQAARAAAEAALGQSAAPRYDYVSRFFAPATGVAEDPVTGSAHTALAPLWSGRLGADILVGFQASARGGLVGTELRGPRTLLTGSAVTVLDAQVVAAW